MNGFPTSVNEPTHPQSLYYVVGAKASINSTEIIQSRNIPFYILCFVFLWGHTKNEVRKNNERLKLPNFLGHSVIL